MGEVNLSSATRAMLDAAKRDGPSAAARAKVWGGVSSAVGGMATASGAVSAVTATTGGMGAAKMLALGTLLGGTLSVGLAATLIYAGQTRKGSEQTLGVRATAGAEVGHARAAVVGTNESVRVPDPVSTSALAAATATTTVIASKGRGAPAAQRPARPEDSLAREASLVARARSSVASGDPRTALQAIHEARALSSRQLGPEELAVEAQALRALGRQDEANEADTTLKEQFPESALAR